MWKTGSGVDIEFNKIPDKLIDFYNKMKPYNSDFDLIIGTDSQNHDRTKLVRVICMTCSGHGGIFFHETINIDLIQDVRQKLHTETNESLTIAEQLVELLEKPEFEELYFNVPISIHIDAGNSEKGKTRELIPELIGWVRSCGWECEIKPASFAASSIADRLSK